MQTQEIEVTIQPDGSVKLHVRGAAGRQCLNLTADLEKTLGGEVVSRNHTPEFDQTVDQTDSAWQSLGK